MSENIYYIKPPEYETDYQQIKINGETEPEYCFPGIKCDVCGHIGAVGGCEKINIDDIPIFKNMDKTKLKKFKLKNLRRKKMMNIPIDYFKELLRNTFQEETIQKYKNILQPGIEFGTRILYINYVPENSFLFPVPWEQLITEDVLNVLIKNNIKDFSYKEVLVKSKKKLNFNQKIYELFINKKIFVKTNNEYKIKKYCEKCGVQILEQTIDIKELIKSKEEMLYVQCDEIKNNSIFRSKRSQSDIFITEPLKSILKENKVKNITFKKVYCI